MTIGRTGSTSLIHALRPMEKVVLPSRLFPDCVDEELVHPRFLSQRLIAFSQLTGVSLRSAPELVDAWYQYYLEQPLVGFKSMPQRHPDYAEFVAREDIRFIALTRTCVASTVASFVIAKLHGTWRRSGEPVSAKWPFTQQHLEIVDPTLAYVLESQQHLANIPHAIRLTYEQITRPEFVCADLDEFFGEEIRLANAKGPTSGADYVENWEEFSSYIERRSPDIEAFLASK